MCAHGWRTICASVVHSVRKTEETFTAQDCGPTSFSRCTVLQSSAFPPSPPPLVFTQPIASRLAMLTTELLSRSIGQPRTSAEFYTFAQLQNARLVHALQPAPGVRFAGASPLHPRTHRPHSSRQTRALRRDDSGDEEDGEQEDGDAQIDIAHHAGVNCCTVDAFEGR